MSVKIRQEGGDCDLERCASGVFFNPGSCDNCGHTLHGRGARKDLDFQKLYTLTQSQLVCIFTQEVPMTKSKLSLMVAGLGAVALVGGGVYALRKGQRGLEAGTLGALKPEVPASVSDGLTPEQRILRDRRMWA